MAESVQHYLKGTSKEDHKRKWIQSGKKNAIWTGVIGIILITIGMILAREFLIGYGLLIVGLIMVFLTVKRMTKWANREDKYYGES